MFDFSTLKQAVNEYIASLELKPGDRLPTESKLCRKFETSHYRVRKIIAQLTVEHNWVTIQGSGTYIPGGQERRPREKVIAVVRPYFHDVATLMNDAHSLAVENKYQFLVFGIDHSQTQAEQECLEHLLTRRLHALIIDPHPANSGNRELFDRFVAQGTRVVLLNGSEEMRRKYPTYSFNYHRAGYMALVHLMRNNVKKVIHITPYHTIAWQHEEFRCGVDDASKDYDIPVERHSGRMMLDVRNFKWSWQPKSFQLPLENDCGYIDDNDPFEASYLQNQLSEAKTENTPVVTVYHTATHSACTTLLFDMRKRMKWIVNELIRNPNALPREHAFNPVLVAPSEQQEPYKVFWG